MGLPDERALIDALTVQPEPDRNRAGFASDCAIVPLGDRDLVATVDGFAAATHFPEGLPATHAGRLAAGATLADVAAAGAEVLGVLAAYGVPPGVDEATIVDLANGIAQTVEAAGGEVLGGDTKPRAELTATLTAIGTCPAGEALTRAGAHPGQLLLVTGPLGGAGAALDRLREGLDAAEAEPLLPPDRLGVGCELRQWGASCAMDLSDGLADAAVALSRVSEVRVTIEADAVPLHPWARENRDGLEHALSTGGDYELVAAIDEDAREPVLAALEAEGAQPAIVGRVEAGEGAWIADDEGPTELDRGYEHRFDDR